jgi:hypothetical protein
VHSTRTWLPPRLTGAAALAALVAGLCASTALARSSQAPVPPCPAQTLVRPFLPWHDQSSYFLAPGGDYESTPAGWALAGGAAVVPGNEPSHVNSAGDASSLGLPAGSSATSPQVCVTIHSPNIRLFALNGGFSRSMLQVSLNYTDKRGLPRSAYIAVLRGTSAWALSPQILFLRYISAMVGGQGQTWVSFTFHPIGGSGWRIDDFYVDPLKSQ